MFSDFNGPEKQLEQQIKQHEIKFQELAIRVESINREVSEFFREWNICPDKVAAFVDRKENFTKIGWEEITKRKQELDNKLQRELNSIRNPIKIKRAHSSLNVARHWLFVK